MCSVGLCATAAFGVTLSAVALKGMMKADKWLTGVPVFKMFGKKGKGFYTPGLPPVQQYTQTPTQMMFMLLQQAMTLSVATQYAALQLPLPLDVLVLPDFYQQL
eukprot:3695021-Rhodomonas_salina.2